MSVGFIGAGQAAQSLVRGFAAAGELCIIPGIQVCFVQARRFQLVNSMYLWLFYPQFQGVIATHKITASAPERDLPTVQGLRVCTQPAPLIP